MSDLPNSKISKSEKPWSRKFARIADMRDKGLSDLEIFEFGKSLIDHFDPINMENLKKESDYQDALFREANDL